MLNDKSMKIDIWNPDRQQLLDKHKDTLHEARRIYSWTTESELAWLAEYSSDKTHLIEIGSYVGKSAFVMMLHNHDLRISSFDTWDDKGTYDECAFNLRAFSDRWTGKKGNSAKTLKPEEMNINIPTPDAAFVDGGHLYADVISDLKNLQKLLPEGTVIAGHDYRADLPEDGVTKAVRELLPNHKNAIDSIWVATL